MIMTMKNQYDINEMIGKEVELIANGVEYRGILVEVSDESVFLKTTSQWIELPTPNVSAMRLADSISHGPEEDASGDEGEGEAG